MPEIPPWLYPQAAQGYGNLAAEGARIGQSGAIARAQLQQESARLNQQYALAQQELEAKQAQSAREDMVRQQQLEIEKSYKEQMLAMQREEVQQRQQEMQLKIQQAAQQFSAQQRFRDLIQQQMDPTQALLQAGPEMFGSGTGFGSAYRAMRPPASAVAPELSPPSPESNTRWWKVQSPEGFRWEREPRDTPRSNYEQRARLAFDIAERKRILASYPPMMPIDKPVANALMEARRKADQAKLAEIEREIQRLAPMPGSDTNSSGNGGFKVISIEKVGDSGYDEDLEE